MSNLAREHNNRFFSISQKQFGAIAAEGERKAKKLGAGVKGVTYRETPGFMGIGTKREVVADVEKMDKSKWKGANVVTEYRDMFGRQVGEASSTTDRARTAGYALGSAAITPKKEQSPSVFKILRTKKPIIMPSEFAPETSEALPSLGSDFEERSLSSMLSAILNIDASQSDPTPEIFRVLQRAKESKVSKASESAFDFAPSSFGSGSASTFAELFDEPDADADLFAQLRGFMPPFFNDHASANDNASIAGGRGVGTGQLAVTYGMDRGQRRDAFLSWLMADEGRMEKVMAALAETHERNTSKQEFGLPSLMAA